MSLRPGDRISDYEVIGMLGTGGMGAVYQVRHLISHRVEAMKVLLPDFESNAELAERFIREIRLQASLSHPNIASLHNALSFGNQLMMVMEFVDGQTVGEIIRRAPLSQLQTAQIAVQVLAALDYAHSRGIIHRDVKPSNVMITSDGAAKLMDFGIARGVTEHGSLTQAGAAVGSLYYMSPEQLRGETLDGRSDLFSTGVTLFEALTGQRPFRGGNASELLRAQRGEPVPDAGAGNAYVSTELSRIIGRALSHDPRERYQTASEFRDDVNGFLRSFAAHSLASAERDLRSISKAERFLPTGMPVSTSRPGSSPQSSSRGTPNPIHFDPLGLERVRKELAQHIGPMAKVMVDRAAKRARSWQELYAQLAPEIPAGKERERFLASYPRG